jgi:glycosidase
MITVSLFAQPHIRTEPPNWWTGMKEETVQLMLYGDNIGHLLPDVKTKGIKTLKSVCPENKNYLFIDLQISSKAKPDTILISLMNGKSEQLKIAFPILDREKGSSARKGYTSKDAIYMITPDRFANGDPTNDEVEGMEEGLNRGSKNGRHGGDIEGIRQHLDYISEMGFTAIWPNPVIENNMPKYSYHGYAITDFYRVDPRMGTNISYRTFCREANQRGIKVIMDMIVNHCGLNHWWMKDLPMKDWINYYNQPYVETNHKKTILADTYATPEDRKILVDGWFVPTMPDMNVRNPWLAKYLIQNTIWWIEYAGLSGIRMDTYLYPDEDFMREWARAVMNEYPDFTITGEVWFDNPAIVSYWQKGKVNTNGYESHLPSLFDFPNQVALQKALMAPDVFDSGWQFLYEMLGQDFQYPDPENLVVFADNHDMPRIFAQLGENIPKCKMAMAHILTTRGIPQIYYGTEILMKSPATRDDGLVRADFPGGWKDDEVNAFSGEDLTPDQEEMQRFVKRILNWRKEASAIHHGKTTHYVPENGVYVTFRYDDRQRVMIILNKNENKTTLKLDRFKGMLGDTKEGYDIVSEINIELKNEIQLNGPGPMIIEFKK